MTTITMKQVQAVDYDGNYAYSRGSKPAVVNLSNLKNAVQIPRENTRNAFEDITRLFFLDGTHLDVFGKPEEFVTP